MPHARLAEILKTYNRLAPRSLDHNDEVSSRSGVSTWHSLCGWYEVYDLIVQSS